LVRNLSRRRNLADARHVLYLHGNESKGVVSSFAQTICTIFAVLRGWINPSIPQILSRISLEIIENKRSESSNSLSQIWFNSANRSYEHCVRVSRTPLPKPLTKKK